MEMKIVSWFSGGVSSAIATKLALIDFPDMKIIFIDIDDHHEDTYRFILDCENKLFYKPILHLKSKYKNVESACLAFSFINGVNGAKCTDVLKRRVRKEYERENKIDAYIWGFDCSKKEVNRFERIKQLMPQYINIAPLIDNGMTKNNAHAKLLKEYKINRPKMYDLGYPNNNCIGCVKGGKGYWNKIRQDFPDVFKKRVELERLIGHSCINGTFLDELKEDKGSKLKPIVEECGIFCEINN
jgi:3'-phosphoadenosine 5'-phosphosulfate sulfotransferase (PAPS reductase)/FAD synthetase